MSYTQQTKAYQSLVKQYEKDKELIESYKDMCTFDISKLDKEPSPTEEDNDSIKDKQLMDI
jgi:hypothetical protein